MNPTELTDIERQIWAAAYGAAFANQCEFAALKLGNWRDFIGISATGAREIASVAVAAFREQQQQKEQKP